MQGQQAMQLSQHLGDDTGTHRAATLAQRKAQAGMQRHWPLQVHRHCEIVARHGHANALWQRDSACDHANPTSVHHGCWQRQWQDAALIDASALYPQWHAGGLERFLCILG